MALCLESVVEGEPENLPPFPTRHETGQWETWYKLAATWSSADQMGKGDELRAWLKDKQPTLSSNATFAMNDALSHFADDEEVDLPAWPKNHTEQSWEAWANLGHALVSAKELGVRAKLEKYLEDKEPLSPEIYDPEESNQATEAENFEIEAAAIMGEIAFETIGNNLEFKLDLTEFKNLLKTYDVKLSDAQKEAAFAAMDTDSNGVLDYGEFMRFLQLRDAFDFVDPKMTEGPVRKEMVARASIVIKACIDKNRKRRDIMAFLKKKGVGETEIKVAFAQYLHVVNPA